MLDKIRARATGAKFEIDNYIAAGAPEVWTVFAPNPDCLAMEMCAMAAVHRVARGPLNWTEPGHYDLVLREGASQAQDWTKLDDAVVEAVPSAK
jgi:hypothetical protein